MMRSVIAVCALVFVVAASGPSLAGGDGSLVSGPVLGKVFEDPRIYIEGLNADQPFDGSWYWAADCQGPTYVAGQTYYLHRIEFMQGEVAGTGFIEFQADDAGGCPGGTLLASGSYEQVEALGWQGADLSPHFHVQAGETYHISLQVVQGGPSSFATGGDIIPHCWSWDCVTWEGPSSSFYWMVRFYGSYVPTPVEGSSWGMIKALYH
jgi:hypothetical protein